MNLVTRCTNAARRGFSKAHMMFAIACMAIVATPAFATSGGFDDTAITDKIAEYLAIAVALATAIILGLWTMRLLGLLKPKH